MKTSKTILIFIVLLSMSLSSFGASSQENTASLSVSLTSKSNEKPNKALSCLLTLVVNGPARSITIQNLSRRITATNIRAFLAETDLNGKVEVDNSGCASVAPLASCTLTFTPGGTPVGPTSFKIRGDNTAETSASIQITDRPIISITGPVQQNRVVTVSGASLSLQITNDASSGANATDITVMNAAGCSALTTDNSNCLNLPPGSTCNLILSSSTPYVPCTITVAGSNTATPSPTALIAFSYLGGLVYETGGVAGGKVVINGAGFSSVWTSTNANIPTSNQNGCVNTILIVANGSCAGDPANCAAQKCRNIAPEWYLPAFAELNTMRSVLCPNAPPMPCNFGGFLDGPLYWSSSQDGADITDALATQISTGAAGDFDKSLSEEVRCFRTFSGLCP